MPALVAFYGSSGRMPFEGSGAARDCRGPSTAQVLALRLSTCFAQDDRVEKIPNIVDIYLAKK
jgi:hypothetical protein